MLRLLNAQRDILQEEMLVLYALWEKDCQARQNDSNSKLSVQMFFDVTDD